MRHIIAVLVLGATLALIASTAFANMVIDGYDVSTYVGCQAWHQSWHSQEGRK